MDPFATELRELDSTAKPILEREQYAAVLDLFEEARKRHGDPVWEGALRKKIDEVRAVPAALYPSLKEKARNAQLRSAQGELGSLRTRVAGWGLKEWTDDLEKTLSTLIPGEPLPARARILLKYPGDPPPRVQILGTPTDFGLVNVPGEDYCASGWESVAELFDASEEVEIRLTFTTTKPAMVTVICRAAEAGGKSQPYNYWLKEPVVGRPQMIKIPLLTLRSWKQVPLQKGMRIDHIYVRQDDRTAILTIHEFVVFKIED